MTHERLRDIKARLLTDERAFQGPGYIGDDQCMRDRRDLLRMVSAAWDEGFTACAHQQMQQEQDPTHPITRNNPYGDMV